MFRAFTAAMPGVKLLANMTEFGRTPFFTASEFEAMGYRMVIWPVSSLRVANKAQEQLFATPARDGGTHGMLDRMQTRGRALRRHRLPRTTRRSTLSIVATVVPQGMPQRSWNCAGRIAARLRHRKHRRRAGRPRRCRPLPSARCRAAAGKPRVIAVMRNPRAAIIAPDPPQKSAFY